VSKEPNVIVSNEPWQKPLPNIDKDNEAFFDGLKKHKFLVWRCKKCGASYWPKAYCTQHENERVGAKRSGLIHGTIVIFEPSLSRGFGRRWEHATTAQARNVDTRILYHSRTRRESYLVNLMSPDSDGRNPVARTSVQRLL